MKKKLDINNRLFWETYEALIDPDIEYIIQEGGARSGKTISIAQAIYALYGETHKSDAGEIVSIVRKSGTALAQSVQRDWFDILRSVDDYSEANHKRTKPEEYRLNGNLIEFMSLDAETKKRGTKRKVLWVNEANELTWNEFKQLMMRTEGTIILDYNPSDDYPWIDEYIIHNPENEGRVKFIHSTYLDNKYLPEVTINRIKSLESIDPAAWSVFGLGKRAQLRGKIYTNWVEVDTFKGEVVYGLDFGFNNQTALIKIGLYDSELYIQEMIHKSGMTNKDLISAMESLDINDTIYCDSAEPQRIEEIRQAGFDAKKSNKEINPGIDFVKRHKLNIVDSPNILTEIKSYKWREDKNGNVLDEPVKYNDHAMDAIRYGAYTKWFVPASKFERVPLQPLHTSDDRYLI